MKIPVLLMGCALIASCGSSTGGGRVTEENKNSGTVTGTFNEILPGTARGVAHDAPLVNARVIAYKWEEGIGSKILGETTTDEAGDYALPILSRDTEVLIQAGLAGYYVEEASGTKIDLTANDYLTAIVGYKREADFKAQVTPFTHLATCYAEYLIDKTGEDRADARLRANSKFSGWAGLDIVNTKPVDITNPNNVVVNLDDGVAYGFISAGISQMMAQVSEDNGIPMHSSRYATSISWTQVACSDLENDGLLNGINKNGQMALGTTQITSEFYRGIGAKILKFAQSDRNITSVTSNDLLTMANTIAISADEIFSGIPGQAVDVNGPVISSRLEEHALVNGTKRISFAVDDALPLNEVTVYIDDVLYSALPINDPTLVWDTTAFDDGEHTVRVVASDVLFNETQTAFVYQVVNNGAAIEITSPTLVNAIKYEATGTFETGSADIDHIEVNGVVATLDLEQKTWQAEIEVEGGRNSVTAVIYDTLNNTNEDTVEVRVDLFEPQIFVLNNLKKFTNYDGNLTNCDTILTDLDLLHSSNRPLCLNTENISLNSREITTVLENYGYLSFSFNIVDASGPNGIFSDFDKINIEYNITLNKEVMVDWSPLPRAVSGGGDAVLPVTVEYFGDDFFKVNRDDVFEVTIRATDESGQQTELQFHFSLDVLTPAASLTMDSKGEDLFVVNFSDRTFLNGAEHTITYRNPTGSVIPRLISIRAPGDHSVVQTIESAQRFNKYKLETREEWQARFCENRQKCKAGVFGDWEPVDALVQMDHIGNIERPSETIISDVKEAYTDVVEQPEPEWKDKDIKCNLLAYPVGLSKLNSEWPDASTVYTPGKYACFIDNFVSGDQGPATYQYVQYRVINEVHYEEGYPRNELKTEQKTYLTQPSIIRVFDENKGIEIFPKGDWYRIPENTSYSIKLVTRLPFVEHKTDTRVSSESIPYGEWVSEDKSIEYNIDSTLEIESAIYTGNIDDINSTSKTNYTMGEGVIRYAVKR